MSNTRLCRRVYLKDESRPYWFEEAINVNRVLVKCYRRLGYVVRYLPNASARDAADFAIDAIGAWRSAQSMAPAAE